MGLKNPKRAGHFLFFFQIGRKVKSKNETRLRTTVGGMLSVFIYGLKEQKL